MQYQHISVMLEEVLQYLNLKANKNYIDCTLGLGGHAQEILKKTKPYGKLLGIEQSEKGIEEAKNRLERFQDRIILVKDNFRNFDKIIKENNFSEINGILLDLGLASWQIEDQEIGLSFSKEMPLDMRLDDKLQITAADILNTYREKQIANLFYQFADVRGNRHLAKKIVDKREKKSFQTNTDLIEVVGTNNPKVLAPIFQALRIEVNKELENLNFVLPQILQNIKSGCRIVAISYHSGEDRIVKNFFRANKDKLKILTKKPLVALDIEIKENPRSRSAKLRAAEKI